MVYKLKKSSKKTTFKVFILIFIFSLVISSLAMILIEFTANFDSTNFNPEVISTNGNVLCINYATTECKWVLYDDLFNFNSVAHQTVSKELLKYAQPSTNAEIDNFPYITNITYKQPNVYNFDNKPSNAFGWLMPITNFSLGIDRKTVLCPNVVHCTGYSMDNAQLYTNTSEPGSLFPATRFLIAQTSNTTTTNCIFDDVINSCVGGDYVYDADTLSLLIPSTDVQCSNPIYNTIKDTYYCSFKADQYLSAIYENYANLKFAQGQEQFFQYKSFVHCGTVSDCVNHGVVKASSINSSYGNVFFMEKNDTVYPINIAYVNATNVNFNPNKSYDSVLKENSIICYFTNNANQINIYDPNLSCSKNNGNKLISTFFDFHHSPPLFFDSYSKPPTKGAWWFLKSDNQYIIMEIGYFKYGTQKNILQQVHHYFDDSSLFIKSGGFKTTFQILLILIIVNIIISFLLIRIGLWRRVSGTITLKMISLFQGKLGSYLEKTQIFDFSGDWFLESSGIQDYDFSTMKANLKQIISQRWRDTIFFPIAISATLGLIVSTSLNYLNFYGSFNRNLLIGSILFFMLLTPFILSMWTPVMWIIDDCGIKILTHKSSGDTETVKTLAGEIKNGIHTIAGFGAIIGIGTSVSLSLVGLFTNNEYSNSFLTIGLNNVFNDYYTPIINLILWTTVFLLIAVSVTINGMFLLANNYFNSNHMKHIKKVRSALSEKGFIKATIPKFVTEGRIDAYFVNETELE